MFKDTERPIWARLPIPTGQAYAKAAEYGEEIRAELAANDPAHLVLERQFETQSVDPMFLEPESGLAWYDPGRKNLELVIGVQSPYEAAESVAFLLGKTAARVQARAYQHAIRLSRRRIRRPRSHAVPALRRVGGDVLPGRPVRLAQQSLRAVPVGDQAARLLDAHRMGVDRATGKIFAFAADHVLHAGGLANFFANVATVAANAAIGIYYVPKVDITTVSLQSRAVTAGSMRGYGTLQTMTALEVLVDEMCSALPLDPIEFRRRKRSKAGERTLAGNPYIVSVRTPEILDKLERHPIWQQRAAEKARASRRDFSWARASRVPPRITAPERIVRWGRCKSIRIRPHFHRLRWHVEMGNGIGTAVANRVAAYLGSVADEVTVAQVDAFGPLALVKSGDPCTMDQAAQDAAAAQSALGACDQFAHQRLDRRACRYPCSGRSRAHHIPLRPVAGGARIVGHRVSDPRARQWETARWKRRAAHHAGIARAVGADGSRGEGPCPQWRDRGDGARLLRAGLGRRRHSRSAASRGRPISMRCARAARRRQVRPPRSHQRQVPAHRLQSDRNHLRVGIAARWCASRSNAPPGRCASPRPTASSNAVRRLVPEVVIGQVQGGFAMSVGHTFLETLPLFEDGPGNGKWNLGQYVVARGSDLPLHDLEIEVLPPVDASERPKGMAEVVMIPVVPALLNAIFDATGHRFQSVAGDPGHAQGSAQVTTLTVTINGRAHGPRDVRDDLTMNDFLREYLGMTGTKFGCGAAQCLSCAVIVDNPDGTSYTSPTCIVPAASFDGKAIRTVEGHAKNGELTPFCRRRSSSTLRSNAATVPPASSTRAKCCWSAWPRSRWRVPISRKPSPRRSTAICAAAPATSNITRPCAT